MPYHCKILPLSEYRPRFQSRSTRRTALQSPSIDSEAESLNIPTCGYHSFRSGAIGIRIYGTWHIARRASEIFLGYNWIEHAALFNRSPSRHKWKWILISVHGALYGFAICALRCTDSQRVMKGQNLISPREALLRCQSDVHMKQNVSSARLVLSPDGSSF